MPVFRGVPITSEGTHRFHPSLGYHIPELRLLTAELSPHSIVQSQRASVPLPPHDESMAQSWLSRHPSSSTPLHRSRHNSIWPSTQGHRRHVVKQLVMEICFRSEAFSERRRLRGILTRRAATKGETPRRFDAEPVRVICGLY